MYRHLCGVIKMPNEEQFVEVNKMQDNQFREVTKLQKEYIDAAACREDFMNAVYDICSDDDTNDRANQIIDVFDSLPAADVTEVKHGKWSATGLCSNCHKPFQGGYFSYYCPNCGTIMDGEK